MVWPSTSVGSSRVSPLSCITESQDGHPCPRIPPSGPHCHCTGGREQSRVKPTTPTGCQLSLQAAVRGVCSQVTGIRRTSLILISPQGLCLFLHRCRGHRPALWHVLANPHHLANPHPLSMLLASCAVREHCMSHLLMLVCVSPRCCVLCTCSPLTGRANGKG